MRIDTGAGCCFMKMFEVHDLLRSVSKNQKIAKGKQIKNMQLQNHFRYIS